MDPRTPPRSTTSTTTTTELEDDRIDTKRVPILTNDPQIHERLLEPSSLQQLGIDRPLVVNRKRQLKSEDVPSLDTRCLSESRLNQREGGDMGDRGMRFFRDPMQHEGHNTFRSNIV
ncbi:hypothetical protein E1B28_007849 [Marasmius oreades]|uniref:Uncharacterized protein n=1 Tax=Marasmius oreades TaxID=181124 RepID=A0A9P7S2J5_9AGAR|nr:uncharacterized protein E1B28_007849 [Marasmius oreades]KAG7094244.1 hypothetical protein E1B28_007849 [Marasmius oreades]